MTGLGFCLAQSPHALSCNSHICIPASCLQARATSLQTFINCATLQTRWGTHSLTKAILLLMETALEEPLNQRFVLLSESDIPLYPPAVVWLQLTSEQKSRIHSCGDHFVSRLCPAFLLCFTLPFPSVF